MHLVIHTHARTHTRTHTCAHAHTHTHTHTYTYTQTSLYCIVFYCIELYFIVLYSVVMKMFEVSHISAESSWQLKPQTMTAHPRQQQARLQWMLLWVNLVSLSCFGVLFCMWILLRAHAHLTDYSLICFSCNYLLIFFAHSLRSLLSLCQFW